MPDFHPTWSRREFCRLIAYPRGLTFRSGIDFYCRVFDLTYEYDMEKDILHFRKKKEN
jgi:hypothetical protein